MRLGKPGLSFLFFLSVFSPTVAAAQSDNRVTILYDAFGKPSSLAKDWGFSALVQYEGRRILFDTGNNAEIFGRNVRSLRVDLKKLDFVVISHRHGDHTTGLNYLLRVNPRVKIFVPREPYGVFGGELPGSFYRRADSLPSEMRYYDGKAPEMIRHGTSWTNANFVYVESTMEIAPRCPGDTDCFPGARHTGTR